MPTVETNRREITMRLEREGWVACQEGGHDFYKHPARPGRIQVPRHRELLPGVARSIARAANWI